MITSAWKPLIATDPLAAIRQEIDRLGYVEVNLEMLDDGGIKFEQNGWMMACYAYDLWDILRKLKDDEIPPSLFTIARSARKPW